MRTVTATFALPFWVPTEPMAAADTAEPAAADAHALLLGPELGDRADQQVLHAERLADLGHGGRARIGAIAVREVLLGQDRVEALALDDAEAAVFDQAVDDQIGDALADVPVAFPPVLNRPVIEVEDGHRGTGALRAGGRGDREGGQGQRGGANDDGLPANHLHVPPQGFSKWRSSTRRVGSARLTVNRLKRPGPYTAEQNGASRPAVGRAPHRRRTLLQSLRP